MGSKQNQFGKNIVKMSKKALEMAKKCKKTIVFTGVLWYNNHVRNKVPISLNIGKVINNE